VSELTKSKMNSNCNLNGLLLFANPKVKPNLKDPSVFPKHQLADLVVTTSVHTELVQTHHQVAAQINLKEVDISIRHHNESLFIRVLGPQIGLIKVMALFSPKLKLDLVLKAVQVVFLQRTIECTVQVVKFVVNLLKLMLHIRVTQE